VGQQVFTYFAREKWSSSCSILSILIGFCKSLPAINSHFADPPSFMWDHLCLDYMLLSLLLALLLILLDTSSPFLLMYKVHHITWRGTISVIKHHIYFCDLNLFNFCDQTSQPLSRLFTLQSILWFITELDIFADHNWYFTLLLIIRDSEIVHLQDGQFFELRECHFLEFLLLRV